MHVDVEMGRRNTCTANRLPTLKWSRDRKANIGRRGNYTAN
jgi:hypothetical protein